MIRFRILEDDLERIARFRAVVSKNHPEARLDIHRTAPAFIEHFQKLDSVPDLICLDHDLFADSPDDPDPGDGRDVAQFLTTQPPNASVLIHSTNAVAADSMMFSMRDHGWDVERIAPLGDDWIEAYWYPTVNEILTKRRENP